MLQDNVSLRKSGLQVGPPCSSWLLGGTRLSGGASVIFVFDRALGPETLMSLPQSSGVQELGLWNISKLQVGEFFLSEVY